MASPDVESPTDFDRPATINTNIGRGFNSIDSEFKQWPFKRDKQKINRDEDAEASGFFRRVTSKSDLYNKLSISIAASFSGSSGAGASASFSWAKEVTVSRSGLYVLLVLKKHVRTETLEELELIKPAQSLLDENNTRDFAQYYGDQFCQSITYGGEIWLMLDLSSFTEDVKTRVAAEAEGHYGAFKGSFSLTQIMNTSTSQTRVSVNFGSTGLRGDFPNPIPSSGETDLATIEKVITAFFENKGVDEQSAYPIDWSFERYTRVNLETAHKPSELTDVRDNLEAIAKDKNRIETLLNRTERIRQFPDLYQSTADIEEKQNTLKTWLDDIDKLGMKQIENPTGKIEYTKYDFTKVEPLAVLKTFDALPVRITVGGPAFFHLGDERNWVGQRGHHISWLSVSIYPEVDGLQLLRQICYAEAHPAQARYRIRADDWKDAKDSTPYDPGPICGVSFKLAGPLSDRYDVCYQIVDSKVNTSNEERNGKEIGVFVHEPVVTNMPAINQLKVRIVKKGAL